MRRAEAHTAAAPQPSPATSPSLSPRGQSRGFEKSAPSEDYFNPLSALSVHPPAQTLLLNSMRPGLV